MTITKIINKKALDCKHSKEKHNLINNIGIIKVEKEKKKHCF